MIRINETLHISDEGKVLERRGTTESNWVVKGNIADFDEVEATEGEKAARAEFIEPLREDEHGRPERVATLADMKAKAQKAAKFLNAIK